MKVEIENLSEIKRKMLIEVPAAAVAQEVDRAYRDLGKQAKIRGFRPGKAPRSILERHYRQQVEKEVADTLVRRSLAEALKEKALEPVFLGWPSPMPQVMAGEDFCFSVEVELNPEFTAENYFGLSLEDPGAAVSEAEVEDRLEKIRQQNAILRPPAEPRSAKEGDFVVLAYQGFFAGQALPEAKAENQYMEIGSGKFNLDFERQLIGLTEGGESRFSVAMPEDFSNPLLAGKVIEFEVKIDEVKELIVPDLDDQFAQNLGGSFQTLADLRAAVLKDMINEKERERQGRLETQALDRLLAAHTFEAPPALISQEQETLFREQWERLHQYYGMNLEGLDHQKMLERLEPQAERRVKVRLLLRQIAAQEGFTISDPELAVGMARVAARSGQDMEQVKKIYQDKDLVEMLRVQLRDEKTMKLILEKAVLTPLGTSPAAESA